MASLLRQIVASPRVRHEESGLDLVYVTDNIIAMSMPASEGIKVAYRNPLKKVVEFLDKNHGEDWAVWEFRAEGTGYSDEAFHNRVFHSPWPDHHPPPFALIPNIMASMRNHLKSSNKKVAVVHCKAGKGRTGTVTCSYLISEENWKKDDAMQRFTEKRMRPSFGSGVSIPSQVRYVDYVSQWVGPKYNRTYVERSVEVLELHFWGLRQGVKLSVCGYIDEGKKINSFHVFNKSEKQIMEKKNEEKGGDDEGINAIFKPKSRIILETNDICIDLEKRTKATYGWTFVRFLLLLIIIPIIRYFVDAHSADRYARKKKVSSLAHCWFNAYFESDEKSGVFEQEWEKMDGIKGTLRKGSKIFDKVMVVWKVLDDKGPVKEPSEGESVIGTAKAPTVETDMEADTRDLGLRKVQPDDSSEIASLAVSGATTPASNAGDTLEGGEGSTSTPQSALSKDDNTTISPALELSSAVPKERDPTRYETAPTSIPKLETADSSSTIKPSKSVDDTTTSVSKLSMSEQQTPSQTEPVPSTQSRETLKEDLITDQQHRATSPVQDSEVPSMASAVKQVVQGKLGSKNIGMPRKDNDDELVS